jgi:dimeric dUTPase (all-alpha-NTP-PPase superfamily)
MKLDLYFEKQRELEKVVRENLGMSEEEFSSVPMTDKRVFAFKVELAEFSNETAWFKYWKQSHKVKRQETLEELVDCIHFLLAIGIYREYDKYVHELNYEEWLHDPEEYLYQEIMEDSIASSGAWKEVFERLIAIGLKLYYSLDEIQQAYISKNRKNIERQANNY